MSEVKVNKISPRTNCGTVTVGDSGDSVSVSAGVPVTVNGDLKSNALKATDGGSIISQSGTTITLGASGDTVSLASGASQSGFGRAGSVDWQTGSIKTATFTAANGEGYFCDTSSGAFTMNLPAGTAGDIVSVADYTRTFQTNGLTITPNGTQKIGGVQASLVAATEGQALTFVYVDDTEGWINTSESTGSSGALAFLEATGGTVTTCGNFKIHTFTGPGTFSVTGVSGACAARNTVGYLVVAGGGGGGSNHGGGGGAGGFREGRNVPIDNFTASPLVANAPTNAVTVSIQDYPITVGAGGTAPGNCQQAKGSNSVFSTITSTGGGSGVGGSQAGQPGGSGGGAGGQGGPGGGNGNTPSTTPAQGTNGGCAPHPDASAGGGGGAVDAGSNGGPRCTPGGNGGDGTATSITGSSVTRGGGGGGGNGGAPGPTVGGTGGPGGGGNGGGIPFDSSAGTANTGGGGGGGANPAIGAGTTARNGGSGIVVIRYKYQ
jgi:hypothetical protein